MAQRLPRVAHTLAIFSGKGGVGKTTVTVNLALALAAGGAQVGIFDADIYGPNVPLMLGVHRKAAAQGWLPVARAGAAPYISPLERFGVKMMSTGLLVGETDTVLTDPQLIGRIATRTMRDVRWGTLDYLLIDLPPGSGEPQASILREFVLDGAIVVSTPQDLSLLDAGRSLGMFEQAGVAILGLIENMSYLVCPHCGEQIEVFHHSERAWKVRSDALEVLGRIPMDVAISRGIDSGHPLVEAAPDSSEAVVFRTIAARIVAKL